MQSNDIETDDLIVKYLDNNLSESEKDQLNNWLNKSNENEKMFVELAKVWEKTSIALQDTDTAKERLTELYSLIDKKRKRIVFSKWFGGSVAAIIILLTSFQILQSTLLRDEKLLTVITENTKKEFILPDSSIVWLHENSELKYLESFDRKRVVYLNGEGYFVVKTNSKKPLTVHTSNVSVKVLGTKFLITDYPDEENVETILESGKINLKIKATDEKINLTPNQKIVYDKRTHLATTQIVNAMNYTSWHNEKLVFENVYFGDVIIQLDKWFNKNIICTNSKLTNIPVSFILEDESIEDILGILQHIVKFQWIKNSDNTIVIY